MRGVVRMQRIIWLIFPNKGGSHIKSAQRCKLFLCVPKRLVLCRTVGERLYAVARAGCRIARGCLITPTSPSPLALPVPMLTKSRNRRMVARASAPVWDHSLQNLRTADGTVSHKGALCARYGFHLLYFLTSRPYTPRLMLIIWCSFVPVNRAPTHSSRVLCAILGSKWRCGWSGRIRDLPASRNSVKTIQPDRRRRSGMISGDLKASTHGGMHKARWASWCFESWSWSELDLTGDSAFSRRLAGPKPCLKRESMGRCDGRCTLVVICCLQLVRACWWTLMSSACLMFCENVCLCREVKTFTGSPGSDLRGWCQRACG